MKIINMCLKPNALIVLANETSCKVSTGYEWNHRYALCGILVRHRNGKDDDLSTTCQLLAHSSPKATELIALLAQDNAANVLESKN
jgi:hypothetical protein